MTTTTVIKKQEFDPGRFGSSCHYWDRETNTCGICHEGLFMPFAQHISAYCLTANYSSCAYFHTFFQQLTVKPGKTPGVRRQTAYVEGDNVERI